MPTHLYCLLPGGSDFAPPDVVADVAVRALAVGGIVAWVASTSVARLTREGRRAVREAVRHDRVIAHALAQDVTPVPATLADPYPGDAELAADVGSRIDEIAEALDRVAGAVEMAVILAPLDSAGEGDGELSSSSGPGRRYLERQRDLPARLSAAADDIDRRLGEIVRASSRRADKDRVGISHLVRRADVDRYRSLAVAFLSSRHRIVVDGPRAPYSFASFSPRHVDAD
jgi:hypothetical protein